MIMSLVLSYDFILILFGFNFEIIKGGSRWKGFGVFCGFLGLFCFCGKFFFGCNRGEDVDEREVELRMVIYVFLILSIMLGS